MEMYEQKPFQEVMLFLFWFLMPCLHLLPAAQMLISLN